MDTISTMGWNMIFCTRVVDILRGNDGGAPAMASGRFWPLAGLRSRLFSSTTISHLNPYDKYLAGESSRISAKVLMNLVCRPS